MENLKKAWSLAKQNRSALVSLIGINLINALVVGVLSALFEQIDNGFLDVIFTLLMLIVGIGLSFISVISTLHLLKKCVFQSETMSFSQMYSEFFSYAKKNWTSYIGTYAIWNILIPGAVDVLALVIGTVILLLFTGGTLFWFIGNIHYYVYADSYSLIYHLMNNLPVLFIGVAAVFLTSVFTGVFSQAAAYNGVYKISAQQDGRLNYVPRFSECMTLAAFPILITSILGVFVVIFTLFGFVVNPFLGIVLLILGSFLLVIAGIAAIVYKYVSFIKIILDESEDQLAAGKSDGYQYADPRYPNMPSIPKR